MEFIRIPKTLHPKKATLLSNAVENGCKTKLFIVKSY
jgi:hypothetical protein